MSCDLSELLERTRPPDPELVDLIEQAFIEGQIDGLRADLAYVWLRAKSDSRQRKKLTLVSQPQISQISPLPINLPLKKRLFDQIN